MIPGQIDLMDELARMEYEGGPPEPEQIIRPPKHHGITVMSDEDYTADVSPIAVAG